MTEEVCEPGGELPEAALPEDDRPPWEPEEPEVDLRAHYDALIAQAEALRRESPDFDFASALRDPDFVRLTAPVMRLGVSDAWAALHRAEREREAEKRGAAQAREAYVKAASSGALRPREGGGLASTALIKSDYAALSRPEQLAFKQRIREAAARGEKVYP